MKQYPIYSYRYFPNDMVLLSEQAATLSEKQRLINFIIFLIKHFFCFLWINDKSEEKPGLLENC